MSWDQVSAVIQQVRSSHTSKLSNNSFAYRLIGACHNTDEAKELAISAIGREAVGALPIGHRRRHDEKALPDLECRFENAF